MLFARRGWTPPPPSPLRYATGLRHCTFHPAHPPKEYNPVTHLARRCFSKFEVPTPSPLVSTEDPNLLVHTRAEMSTPPPKRTPYQRSHLPHPREITTPSPFRETIPRPSNDFSVETWNARVSFLGRIPPEGRLNFNPSQCGVNSQSVGRDLFSEKRYWWRYFFRNAWNVIKVELIYRNKIPSIKICCL